MQGIIIRSGSFFDYWDQSELRLAIQYILCMSAARPTIRSLATIGKRDALIFWSTFHHHTRFNVYCFTKYAKTFDLVLGRSKY
jgi:hypothetical protein